MKAGAAFHRILLRLNPSDKNNAQKELIEDLLKDQTDCLMKVF